MERGEEEAPDRRRVAPLSATISADLHAVRFRRAAAENFRPEIFEARATLREQRESAVGGRIGKPHMLPVCPETAPHASALFSGPPPFARNRGVSPFPTPAPTRGQRPPPKLPKWPAAGWPSLRENEMKMTIKVDNGVNVEALLGAREALTDAPEAAAFKWRATCSWVNGTHSRSTRRRSSSAWVPSSRTRRSIRHRSSRDLRVRRQGRDAGGVVLVGLAGCLTAGIAAVAQNRKIQLRSVKATLEAGMDLQGILGIDSDVRNGFDGIKVVFEIDADASKEDIDALVAQSQKRSAVFDIVTNPTNVSVEVAMTPRGTRYPRRHR